MNADLGAEDRTNCPRCHGSGWCAVCDGGATVDELGTLRGQDARTTWVEECMAKQYGDD